MAKNNAPATTVEPSSTEAPAPPPTVEDLQKILAEKNAALDELAAKLADAREQAAGLQAIADTNASELAKAHKANAKLLDELDAVTAPAGEPAPKPGPSARLVALANMRLSNRWVLLGESFEATEAELDGYEPGTHFDLVKG